jgi:S-adenosylmethionine decarboxylase
MGYTSGLHIIAELQVVKPHLLQQGHWVKPVLHQLIQQHQLTNLGEIFYDFPNGGFTAVVCLSESHLSMHSWPEYNRLHLDVYLSNFLRFNNPVTAHIFDTLVQFYDAAIINKQSLLR